MDIDGFVVSLGEDEREFVLTADCCGNPDCTCTDVMLRFLEFTPDEPGEGVRFRVDVEPEPWQEKSPPARDECEGALVSEFLSDAPEELKEALREFRDSQRATGRSIRAYPFSPDELGGRELVPFSHILDPHGSVSHGGPAYSFNLMDRDRHFIIDDLYCAAPACQCEEALLLFYERTGTDTEMVLDKPFAVRVPFDDGEPVSFEESGRQPLDQARRLLDALRDERPDLVSVLRGRYRRIKEAAAHHVEAAPVIAARPDAAFKAVGRNAPCPCGSGKKYKRCCGR
jgi:hypothetical protein